MNSFPYSIFLLYLILFSFSNGCQVPDESNQQIKLLILSGRNNHDWGQTTPVLRRIFEEPGNYTLDVSNRPDTFNFEYLSHYDAIVSNWNSWPENDLRWPEAMEEGLLKFVREGGGLVFFHASTSVFYEWPDFQNISTGAWEEQTSHGERCPVRVTIENQDHPITKGLSEFYIFDELWIDAGQNEVFQVLGSASHQPAIFIANYGNGRIFHTILGHDARAIRNIGFQTLIMRGTEWAATGEVLSPVPKALQLYDRTKEKTYSWLENDSTFSLLENDEIVWQFNYNTIHGKPFFHPVYLERNRITCLSPDDHLWHLGQWFSWKFINAVNYWEYIGRSHRSEGITEILSADFKRFPDYSAEIILHISYHPVEEETILKEDRIIRISSPRDDMIRMDYDMTFESMADQVNLDRTPIEGEPDGQSWGGYAGLSIRFNQDFMESGWNSRDSEDIDVSGSTGDWLYMGFQGFDGSRVGTAMFISDVTKRQGAAWYLIDEEDLPFYYFSPAYLYFKPLILKKGESIRLKYRVMHIAGPVTKEMLILAYKNYLASENH